MKFLKLTLLMLAVVAFTKSQTVYYVKTSGNDTDTGTSWGTAFATVQKALSVAVSGDQIWVAAGTYKPSTSDQTVSFQLKTGVALYGGFTGTESALGERNWNTHVTILSGDIDDDSTLSGNSRHVVAATSVNSTAMLDGFFITSGNATDSGGGMLLLVASPTLSNLLIMGNSAPTNGGGISNAFGSPIITNVGFWGNLTEGSGGGMYNQNGNPSLTNCSFWGNKAVNGGGLYNEASSVPVLTNVIFRNDTASSFGGGFYNNGNTLALKNIVFEGNYSTLGGGGMFESGSSTLVNFTMYGNKSKFGGAFFFSGSSAASVINTIMWNDSAVTNGPEIYTNSSNNIAISYTLLEGGTAGVYLAGSGVVSDGGNNIDSNPLFTDSSAHDFTLTGFSPAINGGNNTPVTATTDLAENARISDGTVDMGAYEYQGAPLPVELVSFTASAGAMGIELRWKTATEVSNHGFEIERKQIPLVPSGHSPVVKGETSEASGGFIQVGFIEGNGTTNTPKSYSFVDATANGKVAYRLKQIDHDGNFTYSQSVEIAVSVAAKEFALEQNYPNPFNPTTTIRFDLKLTASVKLGIYNSLGQKLEEWNYGMMEAGKYSESINMSRFAGGVYLCRLSAVGNDGQSFMSAKKLTLMK